MSLTQPAEPPPPASSPPTAWEPLVRIARLARRPVERFLRVEAASGLVLLFAAALALGCANSPWAESYLRLWRTPLGLRVAGLAFERPLAWFVNDGLMVIFFFVVGMEIRRELHHGELSVWRRASLPVAAALGGMIAPAVLYLRVAGAPSTRSGWGVPMATDIAFAVGVLALLGKRIPPAVRVLLLALAVIDDLGAIVIIALFYSSGVAVSGLAIAAGGFAAVWLLQRLGVRTKLAYVAPAVVLWAGIYGAGIHPTVAGVILGLMTPVRASVGPAGFVGGLGRAAPSPAESLIASLHPWVAFGIMPVFALANAGVTLSSGAFEGASWRVALAVALGLVIGKPVGVLMAIWLTLRLGVGALPLGVTGRHLLVLGAVAGVGFTMALFIAQLAFMSPDLLGAAKLGVLAGSAGAAVIALCAGRFLLRPFAPSAAAQSAYEAESSTEK